MLYTASFYAPENWVGRPCRVSRQHPRGRPTEWCRFYIRPSIYYGPTGVKR